MELTGVTYIRLLGLLICIAFTSTVTAQAKISAGYIPSTLEFIENKGQWNSKVKFTANMPNGAFFLEKNGFRVLQNNAEDIQRLAFASHGMIADKALEAKFKTNRQPLSMRSHAYDVSFENANKDPEIVPEKALPTYNNYFIGNDPSQWASLCRIYLSVIYKNVYPNIDVRYYTDNGGLKYDLIVHPGARVSDISMKYEGQDKLEIRNDRLYIKTTVGEVSELEPYTYQNKTGVRQNVKCRFQLKGNSISFKVDQYDPNEILVIDPSMVFCTFTGSTADNWGLTATYGFDGSLYAGGIAASNGFPVSTGAYQTSYNGPGFQSEPPGDIAIIRYTPNGSGRIYGTYIGGNGLEQPHSLIADAAGNLVIAGRSNSTNYPTLANNGQNLGTQQQYDIIITKLNAAGTALIGSIKIGGDGNDGVNIDPNGRGQSANSLMRFYGDDGRSEVTLDNAGKVWVASSTQSSNFPVLNAFQSTNAGKQDAMILRLSADCKQLEFASYLGGSENDAAFVLSPQPGTNLMYVAGGTASSNFNGVPSSGVVQSVYGGDIADGFISIINGNTLVKSTFIGTNKIDLLYGIQFDNKAFPYIMGTTTGTMPITNAAYGQAGGKQFIWKLQPDLSAAIYQTTYGPASDAIPNISPTAFLVDRCENVYVSGWGAPSVANYNGSGVDGLPVTPAQTDPVYLKPTPGNDNSDFHFFVMKKNASSLLFGCFFGQNGGRYPDHVDGGTSRFDRNGVIYQGICANCGGGAAFPVYPPGGVWSSDNAALPIDGCNEAAVKISFNLAGVGAGVQSSIKSVVYDTLACVPVNVTFIDTVRNAVSYEWNFGDGSPQLNTSNYTVTHTYTVPGYYTVMLVGIDSNSCNIRDTSYIHIKAGTNKVVLDLSYKKLAPCESFKFRFYNKSISVLGRPLVDTAFLWDFGDGTPQVRGGKDSIDHQYAAPGSYKVRLRLLDTAFCNYDEYVDTLIRVSDFVRANFNNADKCTSLEGIVLENTSQGGAQFYWNVQGDPNTYTTEDLTYSFTAAGSYDVKLKVVDPNSCNIADSITKKVIIRPQPKALFTFTPTTPQDNTPYTFFNQSTGADAYHWDFGDGDTSNLFNPVHQYNVPGDYRTLLTAFNQYGCADTFSLPLSALVTAYLDVPNAFRPGSNIADNRTVKVYGFGITKIKWRIFNRWGELIFEGNNRNDAWDGTYKGKLQPLDVYTYTLEAEFFDGKKARKSGNITLLR